MRERIIPLLLADGGCAPLLGVDKNGKREGELEGMMKRRSKGEFGPFGELGRSQNHLAKWRGKGRDG
jgi:hypothetical protein